MHMSSQTKDEAAQELTKMIHQYANGVATIEEVDTARDAYAQAYADAALEIERNTIIVQEANHDEGQYEEDADTLGMLEALAKSTRKSISVGGILIVSWATTLEGGVFDYRKWTGKAPDDYEFISRAEVEALLKGDAE